MVIQEDMIHSLLNDSDSEEEPTHAFIEAPALPTIPQTLSTPADEDPMTPSQSLTVSDVIPPEDSHKDYKITDITEPLRRSTRTHLPPKYLHEYVTERYYELAGPQHGFGLTFERVGKENFTFQ